MEQNLFNQNQPQSEVSIFNFENQSVRTVNIDNEIWFVASDVTKILGYLDGRKAILTHTKGSFKMKLPSKGGLQEITLINESDLYLLVLKSNTANSKKFQDWVASEVLPSIRKTGSYSVTPKKELSIEEMTLLVIQNMQSKIANQQKQLEEQKPKVEYADSVLFDKEGRLIGEFAKNLNIKPNKFMEWLRDNKYLMGDNMPYQKYIELGIFRIKKSKTMINGNYKHTPLVTGKGEIYLFDKVTKDIKFIKYNRVQGN